MRAHARLTLGATAWLKSSAEVVGAESDPERNAQHWQAKRSVRRRMEKKALGGGSPLLSIATVMPLWPHSITLFASLPSVCFLHCLQCFGVFLLLAVSDSCWSVPSHGETAIYLSELLSINHSRTFLSTLEGVSISATGVQMATGTNGVS